jgi:hypothetical protein
MRKLTVILGMALASFIQAHAFDHDFYYYLSTKFEGDGRVLDILNDGKNNNQIILAKTGDYSGQLWKITPNDKGYYRLTTQWRGDQYSLDVYNDKGTKSKSLVLAPSGEFSGQYWKITKSSVQTE